MSYAQSGSGGLSTRRTPAQIAAIVFGIVFLVIGVAGFIPGLTSEYGSLYFAGPDSTAVLLGIFQVSILHNVVHMLLGFAGLWMARTNSSARTYLIGAGILYLLLFLYGLLVPLGSGANFVPFNQADNWLHLFLAAAMIILGFALGNSTRRSGSSGGYPSGEGYVPN